METVTAVVLAAGKSSRLRRDGSPLPKPLYELHGRTFLSRVLDALGFLTPDQIAVVVGFGRDQIQKAVSGRCQFCVQEELLGTGHAVTCAASHFADSDVVLICYGDMPLLRRETFEAMLSQHRRENRVCTLLTGTLPGEQSLGRVLRTPDGAFDRIVEYRDATDAQRAVTEYNAGVYVFQTPALLSALPKLERANASGEYYLTDVPELLKREGGQVGIFYTPTPGEIAGVNTLEDLASLEQYDDPQ